MAGGFLVQVDGLNELMRDTRRAGVRLNAELSLESQQLGQSIISAAKPHAPVGPPEGGHIVDTMRAGKLARGVVIRMGRATTPYGPILHWGSSYRPNTPAQPFIVETAFAMQDEIETAYLDGVQRVLDRISAT